MPEISALLNTAVKAASKGSLTEHTLVFITMLMSRSPEVEYMNELQKIPETPNSSRKITRNN